MYRVIEVPVGHIMHTGTATEESHVYFNYERVAVKSGSKAKIEARKYVSEHAWYVKQNQHGLEPLPEIYRAA